MRTDLRLLLGAAFAVTLLSCGTANQCSPTTCPDGCCDSAGVCQASSTSSCGVAGSACAVCSFTEVCRLGACMTSTGGGSGTVTGGGSALGGGNEGGGTVASGGGSTTGGGSATGGGTAAGGGSANAGGGTGLSSDAGIDSCQSDAECASGLACHPVLRQCRLACASGSDCSSAERTCAPLTPGGKSFCQCSTTSLCGTGQVCGSVTKVCAAVCTSSAMCPRAAPLCDSRTGDCQAAPTDAGAACTWGSCRASGAGATQVCDYTTGLCQPGGACSTATSQPDVCGYGGFCNTTTCAQPPRPTCSNFSQTTSMPQWDPRTATGPVIYKVVDELVDDSTFCGAGLLAYTITISAYLPSGVWPLQSSAVPGFFYVKTDGSRLGVVGNLMRPSGYQPNSNFPRMANFKMTFCSSATSNISIGLHFDNGNEFCTVAANGTPP